MQVTGPFFGALGMLGFALAEESFPAFVMWSGLAGVGGALITAGAGLYLADISTPRNRSQTLVCGCKEWIDEMRWR